MARGRRRDRLQTDAWMQDANGRRARERGGARAYLRTVYVVLGSIVVLAVLAQFLLGDIELVDSFAPNVATESMGILLVLIFVHRVLERQERAHRLRGSIGALRKASRALERLARPWCDLVKGSLQRTPEPLPADVAALLEPHYAEQIGHCDPAAERPAEEGHGEQWTRWVAREVTQAAELLNQIIIAYNASLDPAYVETIDELVDDPFVRYFSETAATPIDDREWRITMNANRALREAHFARLVAAMAQHNTLARDAAAVRTRRMAPRTGTIGMELPMDHDLRVNAELSKRWWSAGPAVGSLRARSDRDPF